MENAAVPHSPLALSSAMFEERSEQVYFLAPEATQTFVDGVAARLDELAASGHLDHQDEDLAAVV